MKLESSLGQNLDARCWNLCLPSERDRCMLTHMVKCHHSRLKENWELLFFKQTFQTPMPPWSFIQAMQNGALLNGRHWPCCVEFFFCWVHWGRFVRKLLLRPLKHSLRRQTVAAHQRLPQNNLRLKLVKGKDSPASSMAGMVGKRGSIAESFHSRMMKLGVKSFSVCRSLWLKKQQRYSSKLKDLKRRMRSLVSYPTSEYTDQQNVRLVKIFLFDNLPSCKTVKSTSSL